MNRTSPNTYAYLTSRAYAIGDLHGRFEDLRRYILKYNLSDCVLFLLGDNGLGMMKENLLMSFIYDLNELCEERNIHIVMLRGNHDDPSWYDGMKLHLSNILALSDYSVVNLFDDYGHTIKILCVGGGSSIDMDNRIEGDRKCVANYMKYHPKASEKEAWEYCGRSFFEHELPVFCEDSLIFMCNPGPDYILTHTAPSFCEKSPSTLPSFVSEEVRKRAGIERDVMDEVYRWIKTNTTTLKGWYYGHFHEHFNAKHDGIPFIGLDKCTRDGKMDVIEIPFKP